MQSRHGFPRLLFFSSSVIVYVLSVSPAAGDEQVGVGSGVPETNAEVSPNLQKPHMDPAHPLQFHNGVYPVEAVRRREDGVCWVRTMVDSDGSIRATQLLRSTGFGILDVACLFAFAGQRMLPAIVDGFPAIAWINIPNVWKLSSGRHSAHESDPRPPIPDSVPKIKDDYHLQVGPSFNPASSGSLKQNGNCIVSVNVSELGTVSEPRVVASTKFQALDQACIDAAAKAQFSPGLDNGHPISTSTYLAMYW